MGRGELERFLNGSAGEEDHYGGGAVVPICLYVLCKNKNDIIFSAACDMSAVG